MSLILFQVTFPLERLELPKQCRQQGTSIQIPDSIWAIFHSKNISVTLCLSSQDSMKYLSQH